MKLTLYCIVCFLETVVHLINKLYLINTGIFFFISFFLSKPSGQSLINVRRLLPNNSVYFIDVLAERALRRDSSAVSTWCSEGQPVVQTSGFSGDEQIAEDTESDDEGKKNHCCYRETHKSPKTIKKKRTETRQ